MKTTEMVVSFFFAILVAAVVLLLVRMNADDRITHIRIGGAMIVFSVLDKICYVLSLICLVVGVVIGILMIWRTDFSDVGFKLIGTVGLLFVLSVGTLFVNKLIRTIGKYTDAKEIS